MLRSKRCAFIDIHRKFSELVGHLIPNRGHYCGVLPIPYPARISSISLGVIFTRFWGLSVEILAHLAQIASQGWQEGLPHNWHSNASQRYKNKVEVRVLCRLKFFHTTRTLIWAQLCWYRNGHSPICWKYGWKTSVVWKVLYAVALAVSFTRNTQTQ